MKKQNHREHFLIERKSAAHTYIYIFLTTTVVPTDLASFKVKLTIKMAHCIA